MNKAKVIENMGLSIDLSQLKCFRINTGEGPCIVTVEFKSRQEYVYNPETVEYELQVCSDQTEIEFDGYDSAVMFVEDWNKIWQKYLDDRV